MESWCQRFLKLYYSRAFFKLNEIPNIKIFKIIFKYLRKTIRFLFKHPLGKNRRKIVGARLQKKSKCLNF